LLIKSALVADFVHILKMHGENNIKFVMRLAADIAAPGTMEITDLWGATAGGFVDTHPDINFHEYGLRCLTLPNSRGSTCGLGASALRAPAINTLKTKVNLNYI
jgi:hypothetical protein